ncbi:MAG: hypothetical protein PHU25_12990 [Deltaproteobacteria bacterium]|nr:hypothetical protein [Deltaproteobacteria bacterium]
MKGLSTVLGVAIVVAMSAGARAEEVYTSKSDAELDQLLEKLGEELPYVEPDADIEMGGAGLDEWCWYQRPAAYAVSLQHCTGSDCTWTTYSGAAIYDEGSGYYSVCHSAAFLDVDGIKLSFRTPYSSCDYCDWGDWWFGRYQKSTLWPQAESSTCGYDASYIKYYVQELTAYTNYDFGNPEYLGKFEGTGTSADSWVYTDYCPE